eukprot:scaffold1744_cov252-Pinguiococcus_pyrenoidosus.AAC.9
MSSRIPPAFFTRTSSGVTRSVSPSPSKNFSTLAVISGAATREVAIWAPKRRSVRPLSSAGWAREKGRNLRDADHSGLFP